MRTTILAFGASTISATFVFAAAPAAPEATVKQIYRIAAGPKGDYVTCDKPGDSDACGIDGERIRALLTPSLAKAMDDMNARSAKSDDAILDFDPITDSQDPSIGKLVVKPEAVKDDAAIVDVTFWERPEAAGRKAAEHDLRYDMRNVGGVWRVDNIRAVTPSADWDLRKLIDPSAPT